MFRLRDITERVRLFADHVLAASDVALAGDGRVVVSSAGTPVHPHRRAAAIPVRARRIGRVAPPAAQCLSPVAHRGERRRPATAQRGR